ncbi:hypothetical protein BH23ACT2_BH23ACT2_28860 [soil metagenome]
MWLGVSEGPLARSVAIKRLGGRRDEHAHHALRQEAVLLATLDHPHVVRVLDVVDDPPGVAVVLPLLAGGSLRQLLDERGTLTAGEVVAVLGPVADATTSLHRRGIVHGDLKPENILLTGDGVPMLADVGVARLVGHRAPGVRVAGTPGYLDPAVLTDACVEPTADVYALGVVAYEALTGRRPHRGDPAEVMAAASAEVHRALATWPGVAPDVADPVESALAATPGARPASPDELLDRLRAVVDPDEVRLPGPAVAGLGLRCDDEGRTVRFGTEPPPPPLASSPTRWWGRRAVPVIGLLGVIGFWATVGMSARPIPSPPVRTSPGAAAESCPTVTPSEASATVHGVDTDADGCLEPVRWDGWRLTIGTAGGERTYRIGGPGDRLLFGDWNGDGAQTPALHRRGAGQVLYVDRYPGEVGEQIRAERVEQVSPGEATVARDADGRDRVVVEPSG